MLRQILAAAAVVIMLGACESAPDEAPAAASAAPGAGSAASGFDRSGAVSGGPGSGFDGGVQSQGLSGGSRGAAQVAQELVGVGDTVYFVFDSFALEGQAQLTLDQQAGILLKNKGVSVVIEGHCDDRGTREYNLALGERRATAVKDYLVAYGVEPGRIRVVSYGKERPAALGSTEAAWARNRRATTVVAGAAPAA